MRKPFDAALYAENDALARNKVRELLSDRFTVVDNPKRYGVDLLVYNESGEHLFNVETEIKRVWVNDFIYTSVQFPERKRKFCALEKPTYFVMFNSDLSQYLVVKGADLAASPLEMVRNKYVKFGEHFFQVTLDKVAFNNFQV